MSQERVYTDLFTKQRKADYWDRLYSNPATLFEHWMVRRRDHAHQYIVRQFDTSARVLDLGCGAGVLSERLVESGFQVTCADASADMVELCRQRLARFAGSSHEVLQANCLALPFPDGSFDVVVTLGMFGYFDEVTQALREIRRVLRPGGTLILSVRNPNNQYLFDVAHLVRMPLRFIAALRRKLAGRPVVEPPTRPSSAAPVQPIADDGFRIRMFQNPPPLIRGVTARGYRLAHFDGLGYGPPACAERSLLPQRAAIRFSDLFEALCRRTGLQRAARWVADVSFYVFTAEPER